MKNLIGTSALLAGITVLFPALALADSNVAAAYSASTKVVGFATANSEGDASQKAISECQSGGASDCVVAFSSSDMCISLARATSNSSSGIGAGSSRAASQQEALSHCANTGAEGCNLHDTYCAPSSLD